MVAANPRVGLRPGFIGRFARGAERAPRVFLRRVLPDFPVRSPVRILIRTGLGDSRPVARAVARRLPFYSSWRPLLDKRTRECVRRGERREVLFALHKTGAGARSPKRIRLESHYSCR